jgi:hypothetical protein
MNRTERLAAIIVRLQARSLVRARDLAGEFEVGLRTIYRDMETLLESGVPLRAEAGVGYALERGWRLPPLALTEEEAAALLLACRIAAPSEDGRTALAMGSALAKVRAVLGSGGRDYVERLDEGLASFPPADSTKADGAALSVLRDALARGLVARVSYRSASGSATERLVEPCALLREPRGWRLLAWCRLREDYRQFFASRVLADLRGPRPLPRAGGGRLRGRGLRGPRPERRGRPRRPDPRRRGRGVVRPRDARPSLLDRVGPAARAGPRVPAPGDRDPRADSSRLLTYRCRGPVIGSAAKGESAWIRR